MKKRMFTHLIASTVSLLIIAAFTTAGAASSEQEVAKARGDCYLHKQQVKKLEVNTAKDDPTLIEARRAWALSCGRAQELISARDGQNSAAREAQQ